MRKATPLLEVETDKAVTAIPSPFTGKVTEVRVAAGETVHVGDVMVVFEGGVSDREAAPTVPAPETVSRQAVEAPVEDHPRIIAGNFRKRPPTAGAGLTGHPAPGPGTWGGSLYRASDRSPRDW